MKETAFIPTERAPRPLPEPRRHRLLRLQPVEGSVSVIDAPTRAVTAT